jgi:hypothetical protein
VLGASGSDGLLDDDLVLSGSGLVPNQPGLFFQGDNLIGGGAGAQFGDGIRCCGQNIVRLQVVVASTSGDASTSVSIAGHAPAGTVQAGDEKCYQLWYRDPAGSPCGSTFNLTNAFSVTWTAGGTPSVSNVSDTTPAPGQVVTIDGAGFVPDPAFFCGPPFLATGASATQVTAVTANGPAGTFAFGVANADVAQGWGTGPGQMLPPPVPGVDLTQGFGQTLEVDASEIVMTGMTVTTSPPPPAMTPLPVALVNGQICIDFAPFGNWNGGEGVEVEFHFNAAGTHCDFFHTQMRLAPTDGTTPPNASQCAARVGDAVVTMVAALGGACKDIQLSVNGTTLCLFFPGATITSLHPYSHVTVYP